MPQSGNPLGRELLAMLVGDQPAQSLGQLARGMHELFEYFALRSRSRQHGKQVQAREALRIHDRGIECAGLRQRGGREQHAALLIG